MIMQNLKSVHAVQGDENSHAAAFEIHLEAGDRVAFDKAHRQDSPSGELWDTAWHLHISHARLHMQRFNPIAESTSSNAIAATALRTVCSDSRLPRGVA